MTAKETAYQISQLEAYVHRRWDRSAVDGVLDMSGAWMHITVHDHYLQKAYPDLILARTWNPDREKTCTHPFYTQGNPAQIDVVAQTVTFTTRYRNEVTGEICPGAYTVPFKHIVSIEVL